MKLKPFNIVCEEWDHKSQTVWTYKKQYQIIKEILKYYPTFKDFKKAVYKNGDDKLKDTIKNINTNIDRNTYINVLRTLVVKYSLTGKLLSGFLGKLGLAFLFSYISTELAKKTVNNAAEMSGDYGDTSTFSDDVMNRNISDEEFAEKYANNKNPKELVVGGFYRGKYDPGDRKTFRNEIDKARVIGAVTGSVTGSILNPLYLYDIKGKDKLNKLYK